MTWAQLGVYLTVFIAIVAWTERTYRKERRRIEAEHQARMAQIDADYEERMRRIRGEVPPKTKSVPS